MPDQSLFAPDHPVRNDRTSKRTSVPQLFRHLPCFGLLAPSDRSSPVLAIAEVLQREAYWICYG